MQRSQRLNLELAIAKSCSPSSCKVELLHDSSVIEARYSAPVQDTIKIRPRELVAVDVSEEQPEVVYRVARLGAVERMEGGRVGVLRLNGAGEAMADQHGVRVHYVPPTEGLDETFSPGDEVFFTAGAEGELLDVAVDGRPAQPERLRAKFFPRIIELYAKLGSEGNAG